MAKKLMEQMDFEEKEEYEYDMVRGSHGKKPKMAVLNKKIVSTYELDELFLDFN